MKFRLPNLPFPGFLRLSLMNHPNRKDTQQGELGTDFTRPGLNQGYEFTARGINHYTTEAPVGQALISYSPLTIIFALKSSRLHLSACFSLT